MESQAFKSDPLWQKLTELELDAVDASLTFTRRLARENDWSINYTSRVIDEYRRFVYLTQRCDHQVTPSDEVDQAWHLHLTYTQSYWNDLCHSALNRPLHHGPTKGGKSEGIRFEDQYARTLASYEEIFGHAPPEEIWPPSEIRFGEAASFVRVNKQHVWVLPKPWRVGRGRPLVVASCFALISPPLAAGATMNPFDFDGPTFLTFYIVLSVFAVLGALICRSALRTPDDPNINIDSLANNESIAALQGKWQSVLHVALAKLLREKAIEFDKRKKFLGKVVLPFSGDYYLIANREPNENDTDLEQEILKATAGDGMQVEKIGKSLKLDAERIIEISESNGLLETKSSYLSAQLAAAFLLGSTLLIGVIKLIVGISRDKPVGYLFLCLIVLVVISVLVIRRPKRTKAGNRIFNDLLYQHYSLKSKAKNKPKNLGPEEIALAVGLFGISTCDAPELSRLKTEVQSTSANSGGCGSSGCGDGGGCGGGCGGCGGCG